MRTRAHSSTTSISHAMRSPFVNNYAGDFGPPDAGSIRSVHHCVETRSGPGNAATGGLQTEPAYHLLTSRTGPVEGDVLARARRPLERVAERVHRAERRLPPSHELRSGPGLTARRIHELWVLAGQTRRPGQGFCPRFDLPGDLCAPVRTVGRDLERNAGALYSPNLPSLGKQRGDLRGESAHPASENERKHLGLAIVGALVDKDAGGSRHLAGPKISLPPADAHEA